MHLLNLFSVHELVRISSCQNTTEAMENMDFKEHLACPICLEIPRHAIVQCRNGHHICESCRKSLTNCPQCRIAYDKEDIRTLALESLLDAMKFHCPFEKEGCPTELPRKDLDSHENSCKFSPATKLFCSRNLGWKDCKVAVDESSVLSHLMEHHPVQKLACSEFQIDLGFRERTSAENMEVYFDLVVITSLGTPILIRAILAGTGQVVLTCFGFNNFEGAEADFGERFRVKYELGFDKEAGLEWTGYVQPYRKFEKISKYNSFYIPLQCAEAERTQGIAATPTGDIRKNINIKVFICKETHPVPSAKKRGLQKVTISEQVTLPDANQSSEVEFAGIRCNVCKVNPILKIRYKCLQCRDYDLCSRCMELGHHNHHVFVRVQSMNRSSYIEFRGRYTSFGQGQRIDN